MGAEGFELGERSEMSIAADRDLWQFGASELAAAIRRRDTSSAEVVEAHLRRIASVNPAVNAVVIEMADQAREMARAADRSLAQDRPLGPLHGVPFTVKDNLDVVGTPTTHGFRALADALPLRDAPSVERLKNAGAIPIGRTNLPSGAIRWHCESELWGATINPWDRTRTPGASSAGEAVAIATGMSPLGLGNDGLGSLRHPAQCCGIVALKPTLGRVPRASSADERSTIGLQLAGVDGPLARHVADLRLALDVISGPTWRDPWSVPAPLRGPDLGEHLRVAVVMDPASGGTATVVQDGLRLAASALRQGGYVVQEAEPPGVAEAARALVVMLSTPATRLGWEQTMARSAPEPTRRFMAAFFEAAGNPDAIESELALMTRATVLRAWAEFQEEMPLIVAPIATQPPALAGSDLDDGEVARTIHVMRMAIAVNALGLPAVAVPVGIADGLPLSVQVIGPRYREDACLAAAQIIEEQLGVITPIDPW
jgi:amidase